MLCNLTFSLGYRQEKIRSNDTRDTDKRRNRQLYTELSAWITAAERYPCLERAGYDRLHEEHKGSFWSL